MTKPAPERIDAFIAGFFGEGNLVDPAEDPTTKAGQRLIQLLQALRQPSDIPVVLPRRAPDRPDHLSAYVIAWDPAHATMVSELLMAFVGPTYSYFNGLPAALNAADPVDQAVIDLVGPDTTFVLRSPTPQHEGRAWAALGQMQSTVGRRGVRNWHIPKPLGRLLGEFEVSLAAGDNTSSAAVLGQLTATGGLGGANLAHLRIKRLAKIGRDADLLQLPELADVLAADPPGPVRDAILAAIYHQSLAEALNANDIEAAKTSLTANGAVLPRNLRGTVGDLSNDALWVVLLTAHVRADHDTVRLLLDDSDIRIRLDRHPNLVAAAASVLPETQTVLADPAMTQATPNIDSWVSLAQAQAAGVPAAAAALREEAWHVWPQPYTVDQDMAAVLTGLDNAQAERAWQMLGAFLDADDLGHPAPRTAAVYIELALVHNWLSPGDLAGIVALTETVLRSSPGSDTYAGLLDDLSAETERWVGPDRALVALDLADLLVRMPCPDSEARLRLASRLLTPLAVHSSRLDVDLRMFAEQLDAELGTNLIWQPTPARADEPSTGPTLADVPALKVLLYSLDEAALSRARTALRDLAPQTSIHAASDHVGSPQLKQHAQHADIVVMATRCATHAATGFIRANTATGTIITEADGCGSASLLRAAAGALQTWQAVNNA
ncbi:hypothetical protein [Micromonospora rubida]|uniref:hypothetical protein n=1 Tax=Micromonospora rubida TaxID=2697657 RepID=UPI0013789BD4|nr:hypothetical protein [Micromonospora rubida]NBE85426.1 hypothetical protein [Micromonospora rubida]